MTETIYNNVDASSGVISDIGYSFVSGEDCVIVYEQNNKYVAFSVPQKYSEQSAKCLSNWKNRAELVLKK